VRTPVTPEYIAAYDTKKDAAAIRFFKNLATEENIKYVDFRDLPTNFPAKLYRNEDHLNAQGAERYAPLVINACF
jgi:hypothetical protein